MSLKEYLNVPFGEKDVARKHGARFDGEAKKWYIPTYIEEQKKNQLRQLFGANKNSEPSLTNNNHNVDDKSNHNTEERSTRHAEESPFDSAGVLTHHHIEEYVIQHNEEDIAQNVDNNAVATASDDDISEQTARHNIEENITHISDDYCDATQRNNSTVLHQHDDNSNTQRNDVNNTQHNDENADAPIDDLSKWESALSNNTLNIIYMMKKSGLPEDKVMRGRIFRRLKRVVRRCLSDYI